MKEVAIFLSDLHLGQKDQMEEFYAEEPFLQLIDRLSTEHAGDTVDLVLLGDIMDLWTTITDPAEVRAKSTADLPLYFPIGLDDATERAHALEAEVQKVRAITASHSAVFEALGRFLSRDPDRRRLVYVPGNHDHSVVATELQEAIREAILTSTVLTTASQRRAALAARIVFPNWYENASLQVYAEHGNQLTYGGTYRYEDFSSFGKECPGYYELKLVWNRLERGHPELDNVFMDALKPAQWPALFWWLLVQRNFKVFKKLRALRAEYEGDRRPAVQSARQRIPAAWKSYWHLFISTRFSAAQDEFGNAILALFRNGDPAYHPLRGKSLDPHEIKTVILGHSHQSRDKDLPNLDGVKYYNLGSWIFHFTKGRRLLEETWVRISRDGPAGEAGPLVQRELVRRQVELPTSHVRDTPDSCPAPAGAL